MTVALSSVKIYPLVADEPLRKTFLHVAEVDLTLANSDTAIALATLAAADETNGPALETLLARADDIVGVFVPGLVPVSTTNTLKAFTSAAGVGGAATEAMTLTGLAAADEILAVTQKTKGANSLPLLGWSTQAANALTGIWSADPGAGAVIEVLVRKAASGTPSKGEVIVDVSTVTAPTLTLVGGTSSPTTLKVYLLVKMKADFPPIVSL